MKKIVQKVFIFLQFFLGGYLMTLPASLSSTWYEEGQLDVYHIGAVVLLALVIFGLFFWYARVQGLLAKDWDFLKWRHLKFSLLGLFLITSGTNAIMTGLEAIGLGINNTANQESILELVRGTYPPFLLFLLSVVVAPITEEIVFRGILGDLLCEGSKWGYLVSGVIFSLLHRPTDLTSFLVYLWPALVFYWIRRKTTYLESAMLTHFLMNFLAFTAAYIVASGVLE